MSRIYIGRLSYNAREKDVERFFRGFGRIRDINLKNGFGFVEFDDPRDADDAVYELNGRELLGERVIVEHSRGTSSGYGRRYGDRYDRGRERGRGYGPPTRTDYRILVENISSRVSWQDLKDFMRSAGEITFADAHKQRVGEGVVEYATYDDMKNAMKKLDGSELNGRKIKLSEDYRGSRKRSRSRSRSRGRSRSRSRSKDRDRRYRSGSRSRSRDRSRDRSRSKSRSRSRDRDRDNDRGRSRSRSKSPSVRDNRSRSKSKEMENNGEEHPQIDEEQTRDASPQRSRSNSRDRERSGSPAKDEDQEMRSEGASPSRNDVDE